MDEEDHDILVITNVNKRCVGLKSTNMEAVGLREALEHLIIAEGLRVMEVVTDAHPQVPKILSR